MTHSENDPEVPFSIACRGCDAGAELSALEVLLEGWSDVVFDPDGFTANYLGTCPDCLREEAREDAACMEALRGPSAIADTEVRNKSMAKKSRPVHEIRLGRIKAAIWANETENGIRHNVTIARLYKDGNDWRDSTSFGRDDLPLVTKVADMAHTWVYEHSSQDSGSESS